MSTEITPNVPLLLKTLEHIENHPEEWTQGEWGCGTTGCFAFHAALIDGGQVQVDHYFVADEDDDPFVINFTSGKVVSVRYRAARILNLTYEQTERLFGGGNTLDDLRAEVYRLVGDWDKLAELVERLAIKTMGRLAIAPESVAPAVNWANRDLLWEDLQAAITDWQKAEDGEVDLDTLEPQWRDAEVYTNHLRGLVDNAVHKLIGRPA